MQCSDSSSWLVEIKIKFFDQRNNFWIPTNSPGKSLTKVSHFFSLLNLHFVKFPCHVVRHFVFRVLLLSDETLTCQTITSAWAAASRLLQLTVCPPSRWGRILSRSYLLFRILYCCCSQPLNRQAANLYRDMVFRFISEKRKKLNDWHSAAYYYISVCLEAAQYTIFNIRDIPQCEYHFKIFYRYLYCNFIQPVFFTSNWK